jgi:hypothetical protein
MPWGRIGEFACVTKAFVPFNPTLTTLEVISMLLALHPLNKNSPTWIPSWIFSLIQTLNFLWILLGWFFANVSFIRGGLFGMVFEHLQDSFDP